MDRYDRTEASGTGSILDQKLRELINVNIDFLKVRIRGEVDRVKRELRLCEARLREVSSGSSDYLAEEKASLEARIEDYKRLLSEYSEVVSKLDLVKSTALLRESVAPEFWEKILDLRLRDLLRYGGRADDLGELYNYYVELIKGVSLPKKLPEVVVPQKVVEQPRQAAVQGVQSASPPSQQEVSVRSISEREFIMYDVGKWVEVIGSALNSGLILELPDKYVDPGMRRPLRNLLQALAGFPPEQLGLLFTNKSKYKYLLILHRFLYEVFVERKPYETFPGSSDVQYVEGDGGLLSVFEAELVGGESAEGIRRKTFRFFMRGSEVKLVKEVVLEGGRAKKIRYYVT
ncbi:MAG: hypothetical protein QW732_07855 [Zestosphaera sp.]